MECNKRCERQDLIIRLWPSRMSVNEAPEFSRFTDGTISEPIPTHFLRM